MITVVNVFAAAEGKILLVRKGACWILPGGKVEPGESYEQALHREQREELPNSTMQVEEYLGTVTGRTPLSSRFAEVHVYRGSVVGDVTPGAEIAESGWFTLWESFLLPLSVLTRAILAQYHDHVTSTFPRHDS